MQSIKEDLTQIKEYFTKKPVENIERNNLFDPEESTFGELYLFTFCVALNVMNSGYEKFRVASEHKNNAQPTMFCSIVVAY